MSDAPPRYVLDCGNVSLNKCQRCGKVGVGEYRLVVDEIPDGVTTILQLLEVYCDDCAAPDLSRAAIDAWEQQGAHAPVTFHARVSAPAPKVNDLAWLEL